MRALFEKIARNTTGALSTTLSTVTGVPKLNGMALDSAGSLYIEELGASAVPVTALRFQGVALSTDGALYTTNTAPAASAVWADGFAIRADGALHVITGTVGQITDGGLSLSNGRLLVDTGAPTPVITGPVIVDDADGTGSWTATTDIACTSLGMDYGAVTGTYTESSIDITTGTSFGADIPDSAGTAFGRWFYRMRATTAAGFNNYITTESTFDINAVLTNASDGTPTTDGATAPQVDTNCSTGQVYLAVALATQSPDPTEAQIIAGSGGGIVFAENQAASGTTQTFGDITGLSASTNYKIWYTQLVQGATATKTHADLTTASSSKTLNLVGAWAATLVSQVSGVGFINIAQTIQTGDLIVCYVTTSSATVTGVVDGAGNSLTAIGNATGIFGPRITMFWGSASGTYADSKLTATISGGAVWDSVAAIYRSTTTPGTLSVDGFAAVGDGDASANPINIGPAVSADSVGLSIASLITNQDSSSVDSPYTFPSGMKNTSFSLASRSQAVDAQVSAGSHTASLTMDTASFYAGVIANFKCL